MTVLSLDDSGLQEDDEDYNGNVKKKSRTRNPFLDDIAAVDDEEEEDDDEVTLCRSRLHCCRMQGN